MNCLKFNFLGLETAFALGIGELVEKYDVDGVWIDGDCWSVVPDYRSENIEKFEGNTEWSNVLEGKTLGAQEILFPRPATE